MITVPADNPPIAYRLTFPESDLTPNRYAETYPTPYDAWRVAAQHALNPDNPANPDNPDRMAVARDLLDCNDIGVMWGWLVTRHADTVTVPVKGKRLSSEWDQAIRLHSPQDGSLAGTFGVVAAALVRDLIDDHNLVDVAVVASSVMHIGVALSVEDQVVTFTDETTLSLADAQFVAAMYR